MEAHTDAIYSNFGVFILHIIFIQYLRIFLTGLVALFNSSDRKQFSARFLKLVRFSNKIQCVYHISIIPLIASYTYCRQEQGSYSFKEFGPIRIDNPPVLLAYIAVSYIHILINIINLFERKTVKQDKQIITINVYCIYFDDTPNHNNFLKHQFWLKFSG